ncbi:MAG: Ger(x)C family spore germination C-terminal domain-containing protein [Firmicutes bacterium]|nr:Ger(x)C family spore germination C-terminal domain-containing protein [Bacillota bacterium]
MVSVEAPTLLSALESINSFVDRRAELSHTKAIVISKELSEQGLDQFLSPLTRFRQFRRHTFVMVTECPARDFLKEIKPLLEDNPAKYLELLAGGEKYTEFIPASDVYHIYNAHRSRAGEPLAVLAGLQRQAAGPPDPAFKPKSGFTAGRIPREGGTKPELMGAAVFRRGKMVGTITGQEVGLVKMIRGEFGRTIMNLKDPLHPDLFVIFDLRPQKGPEIKAALDNGAVSIKARLFLEGTIISIQSGENYGDPKMLPVLQQALENQMTEEAAKLIQKAQNDFKADIFSFGNQVRKQFSTWPEWERFNWPERFPAAGVEVSCQFKVRRTGLLHETYHSKE